MPLTTRPRSPAARAATLRRDAARAPWLSRWANNMDAVNHGLLFVELGG